MQKKFNLEPEQTIVFIGDSITDADRGRQCYQPFGFGYVHFVANYLLAKYLTCNLKIINRGIGGDTIGDLKKRWQRDCIEHKPDVLSVLIGVNDVWRRIEDEDMSDTADLEEYESTYRLLLTQAKEKCNSRIVICEPFMFCDDSTNPIFVELGKYIEAVGRIADEFEAVLVPLQGAIDEQIKKVAPLKWSQDMVHPEVWAHYWVAQQWLKATVL